MAAVIALLLALLGLGVSAGGSSETGSGPEPEPAAASDPVERLTAREKAALVVVSGLPAPDGVGGVLVQRTTRGLPRPPGALVFVDQEGGEVRAFGGLPPELPAGAYGTEAEARAAGRAAGSALADAGVDVDLAPVLDAATGPLGWRHFLRPELALAFAGGLRDGGAAPCVKHFPGLGSTRISTDESPHVRGRLLPRELDGFRAAVRAGVPCVMVGHAFYRRLETRRASFSPRAYRLLRSLGFEGVAITDSVSVFGSPYAVSSAVKAIRAGADLVLYTNGGDAARAIRRLTPLARAGLLDESVRRVLDLRRDLR
ncbi:MAG TPA: glycoside hydrolase family 3 N-terminal domain-containing protein [Gaiellaceae bacterium]|nr:glycoside hydrolase family 3 N-terminal domain-containing protein [Gaiellaceae bacterium]